jgi:hypothetical protein
MSDSVNQKILIHFPCFIGGFSFHMQGISYCKDLLSIESGESFLKYQDCQWIYSVRFCMTKLKMLASYL